ncbi:MAG: hypothetical protein AYL28_000360 [Candidatus Bathyarchaeota archaeon B23]|nr:MAG: hypothetical protein AYL28_000360 [Candidatus Bathyarchaeota archaeon B23]
MAEARIRLTYEDEATARAVHEAISPDNYQAPEGIDVEAEREGAMLRIRVKTRRLRSLLPTLDDLLACVQAAERALEAVEGRKI